MFENQREIIFPANYTAEEERDTDMEFGAREKEEEREIERIGKETAEDKKAERFSLNAVATEERRFAF